jgi:hypothetical protein
MPIPRCLKPFMKLHSTSMAGPFTAETEGIIHEPNTH